ncbi:MAG: recombinase RecA [Lachnospiraceae bacterium]|nr:recombinase RecA [Lachnospiraceae bacterium]
MAKDKRRPEINYDAQSESEKMKALENAISQLEKNFGKGSVMKFGQKTAVDVPVIPTGSLSLDIALGIGGIPKGRIVEIYGPESSGKTTVALHIVAQVQKAGGIAAYVDAEHALDPVYAKKLGVDIDEMYISQPDDGEQALEIAESMVRSGAIDIIVIDSVAALVPRAEIEGDMGDSHMGLQARLMSQALRKLTAVTSKTNCTVIFINQLREKIGVTYGSNETTTGGRALKFYASVRIDIRRAETIKQGNDFIGNRTKVKVAKNKLAPPFKVCEFDIMYGQGISTEGDILDLGADLGIVVKSGSWYSYKDAKIGQGRETAKNFLKEHPHERREIENAVREHYALPALPDEENGEEDNTEKPDEPKGKGKKNTKAKEDEAFSEDLVFEEELMYADDEEMPELDLSDDE